MQVHVHITLAAGIFKLFVKFDSNGGMRTPKRSVYSNIISYRKFVEVG